jgi:transcriptional regulator with XRE-family HTH domain
MEVMENIRIILGQNLKRRRKALGLNQEGLAERSGLSITYIKNIERGVSWPSPESFEAIADGLGVTVGTLLNEPAEEGKVLTMTTAFRRALYVPEEVYELASELSPNDEVWEEVIDTLNIAIAQKEIMRG